MTATSLRIGVALLLVLGWTALVFFLGDSRGASRVEAERALDRAQATADQLVANRRIYQAGEQLADALSARDAQYQKDLDHAKVDFDQRVADLRSGAVRVSIPVRAATCTVAPAGAGVPAGEPQETRAELTPEAASALEGIAYDGDTAILDLNTCIDRFNDVRAALGRLNEGQ